MFLESLAGEDVRRFKFIDETGVNLRYTRRYGRAQGGKRVHDSAPVNGGENVTIIGALTTKGLDAVMQVTGAVNEAVWRTYLKVVLGPTLKPGDVVVLDNLAVHRMPEMARYAEERGARFLFLPPYSPDFNPIELAWSKLKTFLRTAKARTQQALDEALVKAVKWVTKKNARKWFAHCGYHVF